MTMFTEPFAPLFEVSRQLDRMLDSTAGGTRSFVPGADVLATEDDITVTMDVPGVTMDDLELELHDDVLTVRGERSMPYTAGDDKRAWYRLERGFGKFERVLRVPAGLDPDAIEASLVDGVLNITLELPASRKPRRIRIGGRGQDVIEEHTTAKEEREAVPA